MMLTAALFALALYAAASQQATTSVVHVAVEDGRGAPLEGLTPEDFEVLLDGSRVRIAQVTAPRSPLSIVVLIDVTRSSRWQPRPLDAQLRDFAAKLLPDDRVAVGALGATTILQPFGPAHADIRPAVRRAFDLPGRQREGPSPIWDGVWQAVDLLAQQPEPRALLLLTDGRSTGNRYSLAQAADHAAAHQVSVHVVAQHTAVEIPQRDRQGLTAARVQPTVPLERLAAFCGGQVFAYPEQPREEAERLFGYIAERLRSLLVITLADPPAGTHRLEIRVKRPGAHVHAPGAVTVSKPPVQPAAWHRLPRLTSRSSSPRSACRAIP